MRVLLIIEIYGHPRTCCKSCKYLGLQNFVWSRTVNPVILVASGQPCNV